MKANKRVNTRWMPSSPHREAILECIEKGRAHLEERGHNKSPLFIYEDGGVMELCKVRLVNGKLIGVSDEDNCTNSTQYVDVCGTIDHVKNILSELDETISKERIKEINELLGQVIYMINRMQSRLSSYKTFGGEVTKISKKMNELKIPSKEIASKSAEQLKDFINNEVEDIGGSLNQLYKWAENIRDVASDTEKVLYTYRDIGIEIGKLYEEIKGARNWMKKESGN